MLIRFYYFLLRLDLLRLKINSKLPRLLRITKYGFITTIISLVVATSISVVYAKDCSNLDRWLGDQSCDEVSAEEGADGLVPGMISTTYSIVSGTTVPSDTVAGTVEIKGGLLLASNNLVVEVFEYSDSVSGVDHIADTLERAGIVQDVQAATPGYRSFEPVQKVWRAMRNIALSFILAIGLVISLMILLRVRQGQGYVTLINSLPKLIAAILLILFSYSIAGLVIDIGNVMEKFVVSVFYNADFIEDNFYQSFEPSNPPYPYNIYSSNTPWGSGTEPHEKDFHLFRLLSRFTNFETWGTVPCNGRAQPPGLGLPSGQCPLNVSDIIRTPTGIGIIDKGINIVEDLPADQLLKLIISIVIITGIIKIFFGLVSAFARFLIFTMFAPVILLFFPFSPDVVMTWLRNLFASSLVFPGAFLMMFLASVIMGDPHAPWFTKPMAAEVGGIAPDLLTYSTNIGVDPTTGTNVPYLTRIIALLIVMMIPHLPKYLDQILRVPENIMLAGAKESFKKTAGKIPFVGGLLGGG